MALEVLSKESIDALTHALETTLQWPQIILQSLLALCAAIVGAYGGAYLAESAKHAVRARRFDDAIEQLRQSTRANEEIKNEIATTFSERMTQRLMYREKLEAILEQLCNVQDDMNARDSAALEGKSNDQPDPLLKVEALQFLYFPVCTAQYDDFYRAAKIRKGWQIRYTGLMVSDAPDAEKRTLLEQFGDLYGDFVSELTRYMTALRLEYSHAAGI